MGEETRWPIGEILDWTAGYFQRQGVECPRLDAEVLLAHALQIKRIDLYIRHGEIPSPEPVTRFKGLVGKRVEGCPVAYLVGKKEFYGQEFQVGPGVLIPRPDTECLVDCCLRLAKGENWQSLLDLGTGSGCIAITLAKHLPGVQVTAVDISPEALKIAEANALALGVAKRVKFIAGDFFSPLDPGAAFDCIVSNPPYIPSGDISGLEPGVRNYEPHSALDGGASGFEPLEKIAQQAGAYLKNGGHLVVEIGSPQEQGARERLAQMRGFRLFPSIKDGGGHPRVLYAHKEMPKE
ncbi:MAG: peptide chain release factor N(5)-glutamine methyltransferase [Gemmataceae bacterium]|nr:peptide chain release factor N(5)-glutamine methyltransferase [Gemmataceae bacterium]